MPTSRGTHHHAKVFKIDGRVGNKEGATVRVEPTSYGYLVSVRPTRDKRVYALDLAIVANMVVANVIKREME